MEVIKSRKTKIKRGKAECIIFTIVFIIFALYAISLIYPFIWATLAALKDNKEFFANSPFSLPKSWLFINFIKAFEELNVNNNNMFMMTLNSIWFSVGATAINLMCSCMISYVLAKYKFKARKFIYGISLFVMMIPIVGALPAQFKLINSLHLSNSPLYLLSFIGGFGFNAVVMYGFMTNISSSYAEAAFIDGAGHHRVFWQIILPQAIPSIIALGIIQMIALWNDYSTPLLYLKDFPTLASGLYVYQLKIVQKSNYPVYFAGIILATIPILVLFALFQNTIMQNTYAGGIKG